MHLSKRTTNWLLNLGHDVLHVRDIGMKESPDEEILSYAGKEKRIVITMDLDFPQILAMKELITPGVLLLRLRHPKTEFINQKIDAVLKEIPEETLSHSMCVIEESRIRIHRLPI